MRSLGLELPIVLYREIPLFDVLRGEPSPYRGFGAPFPQSGEVAGYFQDVLHQARERIADGFGVSLGGSPEEIASALEDLVAAMWAEGWSPDAGDVNLFARDIGVLLTNAVRAGLGGVLLLRSLSDLSHASLWWSQSRIEAFPFHKAYKRLLRRDGESLTFFLSALGKMLASPADKGPANGQ